jgi:hypothetical protein
MTQPPDWDRIYANAVTRAENGAEGLITFAPLSSNPVQSMYLTTQDIKDDGSGLRNFHLHIVGQPTNYPTTPRTRNLILKEGYRRYLKRVLVTQRQNAPNLIAESFGEWSDRFMNVTRTIDQSIHANHGIQSFDDGDMSNTHVNNTFYMHICDVMNCYICRLAGEVPVVYLPSPLFNEVKLSMRNVLTDSIFTEEQLKFFVQEIDFLYHIYAYFANFSFVPVRTLLEPREGVIDTANFYTHDDHYRKHQKGKLEVIERDQNGVISTLWYRSI